MAEVEAVDNKERRGDTVNAVSLPLSFTFTYYISARTLIFIYLNFYRQSNIKRRVDNDVNNFRTSDSQQGCFGQSNNLRSWTSDNVSRSSRCRIQPFSER